MPSCFVSGCRNNTGKKPKNVKMHTFPRRKDSIISWLRFCRVPAEEMESRCEEIIADRKSDRYRICSQHFTNDQYETTSVINGGAKLRTDAVPGVELGRTALGNRIASPEQNASLYIAGVPTCLAGYCPNRNSKRLRGVSMHNFPRRREMIIIWLVNCRIPCHLLPQFINDVLSDPYGCRFCLCSVHFTPDQYEQDLIGKLGGGTRVWRRLKPEAVPTIFPKGPTQLGSSSLDTTFPGVMMEPIFLPFAPPSPMAQEKKIFVHKFTQINTFSRKVDKGTKPEHTWTDLISQIESSVLGLPKEKLGMKDQGVQWPEFEFNFVGEASKVFKDHNYSHVITEKEKPVSGQPAKPPKPKLESESGQAAKPPKPKLDPESVWSDFEESDDEIESQPTENLSKDPDYNPSIDEYFTNSDEENNSSASYCTSDEESAATELEEQQEVPTEEYSMPVILNDDNLNIAWDEHPEHWQSVNRVGRSQERSRLPECLDSSVHKENIVVVKTEQEEATVGDYPQVCAAVEGGLLLVVGKEIVMKTVGEEEGGTEEDSSVASRLGASSSVKPEQETNAEEEEPEEDFGEFAEEAPSDAVTEFSSIKPEDEASSETEDSDEGDGPFAVRVSLGAGTGSRAVDVVNQESADVPDLHKVLSIKAQGSCKRPFSLNVGDSDTSINPTGKSTRYRNSTTQIESLGNLTAPQSCAPDERRENPHVVQEHTKQMEATYTGTSSSSESRTPFWCANCGITFTPFQPRIILQSFREAEEQLSCPNCGNKCSQKQLLFDDQTAEVVWNPHACPECQKNFENIDELNTHTAIHSDNPYWGAECERSFKSKAGLHMHRSVVHVATRRVKCKECGKRFNSKRSWMLHRRCHKKLSKLKAAKLMAARTPCKNYFQCSECDQSFATASVYFAHERCHSGDRPFKCKECGKGFKVKGHLMRHLFIHGIAKPFQCDACDKGFTKHCYYVRHVNHHKETNPSCTQCRQCFPTSLCLRRHERDKHGEHTVHKCRDCGKEFRRIHYFVKHQKSHLQEGSA